MDSLSSAAKHPPDQGVRCADNRRPLARLFVLLVLYSSLTLAYSLVTPVYEGPDEPMHYAYVRHLTETWRLPPLTEYGGDHPAQHETSQPPLYYVIAALFTFWTPDHGDYATLLERNPHFAYPAPLTVPDNKNVWLHTLAEDFPWRGTVLAIRLTRLVSSFLGALASWPRGVWGGSSGPRRCTGPLPGPGRSPARYGRPWPNWSALNGRYGACLAPATWGSPMGFTATPSRSRCPLRRRRAVIGW
jgi:hypothetical protein